MKVEKLSDNRLEAFKAYCREQRLAHDESYLYEEDIEPLKVDKENPTLLLIESNTIIGCLSFMLMDYFVKGDKSRIRIFHCLKQEITHYKLLFESVQDLELPVGNLELFLPDANTVIKDVFEKLGWSYYRTAYVMVRKDQAPVTYEFPEGYTLKTFVINQDEQNYIDIRNKAFKTLKGSEVALTLKDATRLSTSEELLKDGIQVLWYKDEAIALIRMILEDEETEHYSFVAPIVIKPEFQGRGLGTELLKAGIVIGQENNLPNCMLSVNGENDQALRLYKKNGFTVDMSLSCYHYSLSKKNV